MAIAAVLAAGSTFTIEAQAKTQWLKCPNTPYFEMLKVDLAKKTIFDPLSSRDGKLSAKITATDVSWRQSIGCAGCEVLWFNERKREMHFQFLSHNYDFDRRAGILRVFNEYVYANGQRSKDGPFSYSCVLDSVSKMKF